MVGAAVPSRAEAANFAREHAVIPVYRELLADTLTPVTAFERLCGSHDTGFLLEGGAASYVGHRPALMRHLGGHNPLSALEPIVSQPPAPVPGLPPFVGGAVGYLGYEAARHFERLPTAPGPAPDLPESAFLAVHDLVIFDHANRRMLVLALYRPARESYDDALDRVDQMVAKLSATADAESSIGAASEGWRSNTTRDEFEERVERARAYIAAGDAFQIVLSQRFSKPLRTDPHTIYGHLRAVNPSPYMYHLNLGAGRHVVGASPELLVKADGRTVQTRPLAGTRRRGADRTSDLALERELLSDPKERGEHVMLVDLGRHDLGRVCEPGTVRVDKLMEVERFSHVMHISSTVSGALSPRLSCLDAVRSTFPAGTLSGAPKIRAMEIIAELEAERRGVYGGAVGYVGFGGATDLAIGLRTIVVANGRLYAQAGAGIVADSDPAAEYQETLHKANAMFTAVRHAEGQNHD